MAIKVRAIYPGVFGIYREPGDEFSIQSEKQFSKRWMEKVDADEEEPKKGKGKAKATPAPEESDSDVI